MKKLNDILKKLRSREGLTQEELAKKLEMSRSAISMYERGDREPSVEILEIFADFFNVDMNYLTGQKEEQYYYDLQTKQIAQEIFENKELRLLFNAGRGARAEDLQMVSDMLMRLKKAENHEE